MYVKQLSPRFKRSVATVAGCFALLLSIGTPRLGPYITLPVEIEGVEADGISPTACTGLHESFGPWGAIESYCPANHAYYGTDDPAGPAGPPEILPLFGSCCPLPAADILSEEHVFVREECPLGHVVTGSRREGTDFRTISMRCTKINEERYRLARAKPAVYWGKGAAGFKGALQIGWKNIPPALRYSQGHMGERHWDIDGCVGYPWGSMLTKKSTKHCSGFYFSQLQYNGAPGDPAQGTPVKMLPECAELEDGSNTSLTDCTS